ncbi:MAG: Ig-like domain-containing protein, partial [Bacteroidaceae bacterium]|nr:Ig-like domain-containing protein [Bacteroidaceae bacterium]
GSYKNETLTTENVTETITYVSSNENVATIASDGTVTAIKNGSCIITAKSGEAEASYIITVIDDVNAGITQIGNGDFEDWRNVTSSNHAPNNWNSFETAEGSLASTASAQQVAMIEGGRPGSDGLYCVDIYSREINFVVYRVNANGNLTLGCINAGDASAAGSDNHNFSKVEDSAKSETISKIPSAIKFWVKFVPGSESYNARMAATVHDAYNYITYGSATHDNDANKVHAIAQAEKNFPACEWTEMTVPFTMTGNAIGTQMYIVVNFTTNKTPGGGGASDHLYIDDIELIYDSEESTPAPTVYSKNMSVVADDEYLALTETSVEVTNNGEMTILGGETIKTIDFNLKDFSVGNSNVGDVAVRGLRINDDGTFNYNNSIQIAEGDMAGVHPMTLQGTISDDYFYVNINMDFGYSVLAEVGDVANTTLNISDALYGTFCAPFTVALPESVKASIITAANGNELVFEPVAGNVVLANTPVLVEASAAESLSVSGVYAKGTPVAGLLTGVYENTPAPVGSYVLQNLDKVGFYLVAEGNQPTVGANRCYLTAPAAGVKAFFLNGGDATGISGVDANVDANEAIYNLAGQRINKLQKGINIINGKKILK